MDMKSSKKLYFRIRTLETDIFSGGVIFDILDLMLDEHRNNVRHGGMTIPNCSPYLDFVMDGYEIAKIVQVSLSRSMT